MKTNYKVTIEETISQDFEVEANTIMDALEIAEQKYKNGIFVLSPGTLVCTKISADDGKGDCVD